MKLSREKFWFCLILHHIITAVVLLNVPVGESITKVIGILAVIVYFMLLSFRLKDAGKSRALILKCFVIPIYFIYIGMLPSKKEKYYRSYESEKKRNTVVSGIISSF